ncbi:MAG: MaoC/PaaZ C-terminal domain-containing protein [Pirellulales bacterium]
MPSPSQQGPLYFEGVEVGQCWVSPGRTITETDIVNFAGMTGDYNPLHTDHEYCRGTPYGKPIAHGMLGMSLVAGLGGHSPWMQTAAFTRIVHWNFTRPLFVGDTVRVETEVTGKQSDAKRRGVITWRRRLLNQHDEVVQEGTTETLVLVDPTGPLATRTKPAAPFAEVEQPPPAQQAAANGTRSNN